jgi:CRISPR-associated protein Cmr2
MPQSNSDWKVEVLSPLLEYPTNQSILKVLDKSVVLLSADVDRVQDYVFESTRLPEIQGASMLVDELNHPDTSSWQPPVNTVGDLFIEEDLPEAIIYSAGGSLLAILPDLPTAERIKARIEGLFPRQTGLVTTTCIIYETAVGELLNGYRGSEITPADIWSLRQEFPSDWERLVGAYGCDSRDGQKAVEEAVGEARCFGQMVELMSILLRRAKDDRRTPLFHETLPHSQRCRSCGRRPASFVGQYADVEELWPLCEPCALKLQDRTERRSAWLYEEDWSPALPERYYGDHRPEEINTANDLTEIGEACQARKGYVGFIYADGDSIGKYMQSQRTPGEYKKASRGVISATRYAVYEALAVFLQPERTKRQNQRDGREEEVTIHPFEIITIGGDDVLLIVPADVALPIAVNICDLFGQSLHGEGLTMSAGVVLAQSHTPVRALRDIARQLLKSAKRRARETSISSTKEGGLDFLVLTSQSMLRRDVDNLRGTYPIRLPGEGVGSRLRLTGAPYTLSETIRLLSLVRSMRRKNFPASQLHQLVAALHKGRELGSLHFLYQQARLQNRPYGKILKDIDKLWDFHVEDPIPWQEVGRERPDPDPDVRYTSILPDLADLFGFAPNEEILLQRWDHIIKEAADADSN